MKRYTNKEYIERCKEKFGDDRFDYSLTEYINNYTRIIVRCKIHDKYFYPNPGIHYMKETGCSECTKEKLRISASKLNNLRKENRK